MTEDRKFSAEANAGLVIVLAVLAVHLVSLILPYYFVDDVWLYRRPEFGFPDRYGVVVVRQGRPIMAALALGTQALRARFGVEAMLIIRGIATAAMMAFGYFVYRFFRLWQPPLLALCLSVLLVTLPSFQMYVSAAPILAPLLAYCGFVVLMFGRFVFLEKSRTADWSVLILSTLGLIFVWATYQGIPLVVVGLLTPLLLSGELESNRRRRVLIVFLFTVGMSLALYYGLWRLANIGVPADGRYSPRIGGFYLLRNWPLYRASRIPQIFGFWDTRSGTTSYLYASAALVAAACAFDLIRVRGKRISRGLMWAAAIAAVVAVDAPVLLAPTDNFSYMTSAPGATAAFLLVAASVVTLCHRAVSRIPAFRVVAVYAAVLLCASAVFLAARNVALGHVVPNWLEYALVRDELRRSLTEGHKISSVTVYARNSLSSDRRNEFRWSNFSAPFWVQWAVRDILDELGQNSNVRIDVRNSDGSVATSIESLKAGWVVPPLADRHVTIDLRALNLSDPPGSSFRETPPLALSQIEMPVGPPLPPPAPPEGLRLVQIGDIHSTMTFARQGAKGERAAIDGDLRTPAADPNGLNPSTVVVLQLQSPEAVTGVRIFTAQQFGVSRPVTLSVSCNEDGVQRALGTIAIRAGTDGPDNAQWSPACRTQSIRLVAAPGSAAGNFWISEFQIFGAVAR